MSLLQNLAGKSFQDIFSGSNRFVVTGERTGPVNGTTILSANDLEFIAISEYTVSTDSITTLSVMLGDVVIDRLYMTAYSTVNVLKAWNNPPTGAKGGSLKISSTGSGTVFISACVILEKKAPISST